MTIVGNGTPKRIVKHGAAKEARCWTQTLEEYQAASPSSFFERVMFWYLFKARSGLNHRHKHRRLGRKGVRSGPWLWRKQPSRNGTEHWFVRHIRTWPLLLGFSWGIWWRGVDNKSFFGLERCKILQKGAFSVKRWKVRGYVFGKRKDLENWKDLDSKQQDVNFGQISLREVILLGVSHKVTACICFDASKTGFSPVYLRPHQFRIIFITMVLKRLLYQTNVVLFFRWASFGLHFDHWLDVQWNPGPDDLLAHVCVA